MVCANVQQGRRGHMLMVSGSLPGHCYPVYQILYLLSSPQYVNRIIVTVVDINVRLSELDEMKRRGDFGSLDLRFLTIDALEMEEAIIPAKGSEIAEALWEKPGAELFSRLKELAFEPARKKLLQEKNRADAPTCILSDMFFTFLLDIAEELEIPWYPMVPSATRYTYSCFLGSNPLFRSKDPEVRKKQTIPGLEFARVFDYPTDVLDYPEFFAKKCERFQRSTAIVVNDVEAWDAPCGALSSLLKHLASQTDASKVPRVMHIGPIANIAGFRLSPPPASDPSEKSECLAWIDKQPANSVLYIAFGTVLNLTKNGMSVLAHGLEISGVSFLWVLKLGANQSLASHLPPGFLERTRGRGFIETGYAPQTRVLQHPAIGGFLSHCGWNSCMESICCGVPLITWPISLDQPLNARFLVNVWKAAIGVKKPDEDYGSEVSREEVKDAIQSLMMGREGEEARKNILKLKNLAEIAVKEGGPSYTALRSFADEITNCGPSCIEQ